MADIILYPNLFGLSLEGLEGEIAWPSHCKPCLGRSPTVAVDVDIAVLVAENTCLAHIKRVAQVQSKTCVCSGQAHTLLCLSLTCSFE